MCKLFVFVMLTLYFTLYAQNTDQESGKEDASSESVIIEEEEDILVDEEDEDLLKATDIDEKGSDDDSMSDTDDNSRESVEQPESEDEKVFSDSEDELILDGGEESILGEEQLVPREELQETLEPSKMVQEDDSGEQREDEDRDSLSEKMKQSYRPDPETVKRVKSVEGRPEIPSPQDSVKLEEKTPVRIEKMQSINFAENVSRYRSPKLAMLMSFLVPGTGQAYARCGWRAGLYGAVEAAIIGIGATFGVKGKNAKKDAKEFANEHYDFKHFDKYYNVLSRHVGDDTLSELFSSPSVDTFKNIYERKSEDFYKLLRDKDNPFIHGWEDVTPGFDSITFVVDDQNYRQVTDSLYLVYRAGSDSTKAQFGFSEYQKEYDKMMSESNSHYRVSKNVLTLLIVNHIVSALDAGITARAYNDKLLGKQSVWQNINLKEQQIATVSGILNGYVLQVRF